MPGYRAEDTEKGVEWEVSLPQIPIWGACGTSE